MLDSQAMSMVFAVFGQLLEEKGIPDSLGVQFLLRQ